MPGPTLGAHFGPRGGPAMRYFAAWQLAHVSVTDMILCFFLRQGDHSQSISPAFQSIHTNQLRLPSGIVSRYRCLLPCVLLALSAGEHFETVYHQLIRHLDTL